MTTNGCNPILVINKPCTSPIKTESPSNNTTARVEFHSCLIDNAISAADFEVVQVVERVWGYQFAQAGKTKYAPATTDAVFAPHGRSASLNDAICRRVLTISRSGVAYQNCCLDDLQELAAARIKEEAKHKNLNSTNAAFALDGETAQAKGPYLSSKEELGAKVQRMGAVAGLRDMAKDWFWQNTFRPKPGPRAHVTPKERKEVDYLAARFYGAHQIFTHNEFRVGDVSLARQSALGVPAAST